MKCKKKIMVKAFSPPTSHRFRVPLLLDNVLSQGESSIKECEQNPGGNWNEVSVFVGVSNEDAAMTAWP